MSNARFALAFWEGIPLDDMDQACETALSTGAFENNTAIEIAVCVRRNLFDATSTDTAARHCTWHTPNSDDYDRFGPTCSPRPNQHARLLSLSFARCMEDLHGSSKKVANSRF